MKRNKIEQKMNLFKYLKEKLRLDPSVEFIEVCCKTEEEQHIVLKHFSSIGVKWIGHVDIKIEEEGIFYTDVLFSLDKNNEISWRGNYPVTSDSYIMDFYEFVNLISLFKIDERE